MRACVKHKCRGRKNFLCLPEHVHLFCTEIYTVSSVILRIIQLSWVPSFQRADYGNSHLHNPVSHFVIINTVYFLSLLFTQSCPTLWDVRDCNTPGFPVLHYLPELAQTVMTSNHLILFHPIFLLLWSIQTLESSQISWFSASGGQRIGN